MVAVCVICGKSCQCPNFASSVLLIAWKHDYLRRRKEVMFLPHVCLSVCLFARLFKTDFDEIFIWVERGPRNSRLDFGGDPDYDTGPGNF